jgi:hypothetical protein
MRKGRRPQHTRPYLQDIQKSSPSNVPRKKFFGGLLLIISVICAGILVFWWFASSTWDSEEDQHIVIVPKNLDVNTKQILLLTYHGSSKDIQLRAIPADVEVRVVGGYGKYPLKSVYPLLVLDKKNRAVIQSTYTYGLQTPIDQVWVTAEDEVFAAQTVADLGKNILSRQIEASLSLKDRVELYQLFREHKAENKVEYATLDAWHSSLQGLYSTDFKPCRVGIRNTQPIPGLGRELERVFSHAGATVVRLSDDSSNASTTKVLVQTGVPSCQVLLKHLRPILPGELTVEESNDVFARSRTELDVIIGQDLGKFLEK